MKNNIHSTIERDDRISRYIKGQMDSQEEALFLADLDSDEQLRQDAIAQARLVRGMCQVDDELVQALKNTSESDMTRLVRPRKIMFRKPAIWLSAAASVAVLLCAGYKGYDYYETTRLGMKYAQVFTMETLVRGDSDTNVELELQTLFNNVIERKDLATTTERLSELWQLANQDTYNDYTDYAPYIGWYLAIGYLEDYEKDKAKLILTTLLQESKTNSTVLKNEISSVLNAL